MPNPLRVWIEMTCYPSWTGQEVTEYLLQARCCQAVGSPQGDQNQCCLEETQKSKEESWEQINYRTAPHVQQYKTLSRKVQRWHREGSGYMFKGPSHACHREVTPSLGFERLTVHQANSIKTFNFGEAGNLIFCIMIFNISHDIRGLTVMHLQWEKTTNAQGYYCEGQM